MNNTDNNKKNIALFISSLHGGGAERVVSRLSHALSDRYNVYVFLIDGDNQQYSCSKRCTVVDLGAGKKNFRAKELKSIMTINSSIKKYNIDACISFLSGANMINSFFVRNCKKIVSIRIYINKKTFKEYEHKGFEKFEIQAYKAFCKKSDLAVAITRKMGEALKETYNLNDDKIKVIENPYDLGEIQQAIDEGIESSDTAVRDFINTHKTTVSVGRLTQQKDYFSQLKAFKRVVERVSNAGLMILGEGDLKPDIESYIKELGLTENVILAGRKSNPFPYIAASELYISTSHVEGFPNGLVEAMACHVAPLHTNCLTGPDEILTEDCGVLLPDLAKRTGDELEQAIDVIADEWTKLLNDDNRRRRMSDMAYNRARDYSYEAIADKWEAIIG